MKKNILFLSGIVLSLCFLVTSSCHSQKYERSYLKKYHYSGSINHRVFFDSLDFYFGSTATIEDMKLHKFSTTFNSITPENALKWGSLICEGTVNDYNFTYADSLVNEALMHGYRVRGHTLIWGSLSDRFKSPDLEKYLKKFPKDKRKEVLLRFMEYHIDTVVTHFKGRILDWDVVNEPLNMLGGSKMDKTIFYRYFGEDYVAMSFKMAHKADSTIKLFLNEQLYNYAGKKAQALLVLVEKLKREGVPVNGVGLQSHVIFNVPTLEKFKLYIDKLSSLGVEIEITEMDARLRLFRKHDDPFQAQAEFYKSFLDACLENKNCKGITFWGYTDKDCWLDRHMSWLFRKPNEPYIFDSNMEPKPFFYMINQDANY